MIELLAGPWGPLAIFGLRVVDVSLGTTRLLLLTRGHGAGASLLGFVEIVIWITAAGSAIQNLDSPWHVVGYAGGFATGTAVGIWMEDKLALGTTTVQAICRRPTPRVAATLRGLGFGVTELRGEGLEGPVDIVSTVVRRRVAARAIQAIELEDPDAFIAMYDTQARRGWQAVARRK